VPANPRFVLRVALLWRRMKARQLGVQLLFQPSAQICQVKIAVRTYKLTIATDKTKVDFYSSTS
jgi:hypothetical protein